MKKALLIVVILSLGIALPPARAQEDFDAAFDEMEEAFEEAVTNKEEAWDKVDAALEARWEAQVKQEEEEWEKLRAAVEQKWDEFYYSTNKEWVEYDDDKDTRSRVDFEKGEIEISTLVAVKGKSEPKTEAAKPVAEIPASSQDLLSPKKPEEKKEIITQAEKKIERQVKKIFSPDNSVRREVLKDQVEYATGETVTQKNVTQYTKEYVAPKMKLEKKIIQSKDGEQRLKFTVKIKMVPKHLEIRAGKFKEQVKKYVNKYKLDPALVFAVIHTESYFNPLAKSRIPAYGLMQLVPRYAALESYQYLHGEKKLLDADYLYNPDNNITLGTTYLHLLHTRYFKNVKRLDNRLSLSIAAYNGGPTRVNKRIVKKYDVNNMENEELVKVIGRSVPAETRDYLQKVQKRMALYEGMM